MKHLKHLKHGLQHAFSPFFRTTQYKAGEQPVLASQRPRMVARPDNG
jgi:hypothetical protein